MKKALRILFSTIALCIISIVAIYAADTIYYTKKGYVFAQTEEKLDQAIRLSNSKDYTALQKMLDSKQAYILNVNNAEVYITKYKVGKVRFRLKGEISEFWTVSEAITKTKN